MMFTLEVLKARHGDCLILHHGSKRRPRRVLIDGGPHHVFKRFLKPRLKALQQAAPDQPLALDLVMVSHMDQDHIKGILDLFKDISSGVNDQEQPLVDIRELWHNAFPDLIGEAGAEADRSENDALKIASMAGPDLGVDFPGHTKLVLSSVREARQLRDDARAACRRGQSRHA